MVKSKPFYAVEIFELSNKGLIEKLEKGKSQIIRNLKDWNFKWTEKCIVYGNCLMKINAFFTLCVLFISQKNI